MKLSSLVAVLAIAVTPVLVSAQAHLPNLKDRLKVHQERLPRPSHSLYKVHSRRLAVNQKGGRRQVRVLSHKQHHDVRKSVRTVTHHLTAPHHPERH